MAPPISQARAALRAVHRMNSLATGSRRCALLLCSLRHLLRQRGWNAGSQMRKIHLDACLWNKGVAVALKDCKVSIA